jgi:hypothetical protein
MSQTMTFLSHRLKPSGNWTASVSSLTAGVGCASWLGTTIFDVRRGALMSITEAKSKFWDLDFKSLMPVILFLVTQMIIGATWISRIDTRLTVREAAGEMAMKRLEKVEQQTDRLTRLEEALKHISLGLDKLDRKLDAFSK